MAGYGDLRVPFGEKNGRLYTPDEVDQGKACGCYCPSCQSPLIANLPKVKRNYFSHHRAKECAGGYETALHRMGKQIIEDAGYVWLPSKSFHFRVHVAEDVYISENVVFEPHRTELLDVVSEQMAEIWRPDLTANLKNGSTVYIEIKVSHEVDEPKARALDNLMEIDLATVSPEEVRDLDALREIVLRTAPRHWYRCSLYDDLPRVHAARKRLEDRLPAAKAKFVAEREAKEKREQEKLRYEENKERQRELYAPDVEKAFRMQSEAAQTKLHQQMEEKCVPAIGQELARLHAAGHALPDRLPFGTGVRLKGDWIVRCHYSLWQMFVLEHFIINAPVGHHLTVRAVVDAVRSQFGYIKWMDRLATMKLEGKKKGRKRGTWYADSGVWFLTESENQAIKTPYYLMLQYLRRLCDWPYSLLTEIGEGYRFTIISNRPHARYLEHQGAEARAEQQREARRRSIKREAEMIETQDAKAILDKLEAEQREAEAEARRFDRNLEIAEGLYRRGVSKGYICNRCHVLMEQLDAMKCVECGSHAVQSKELSTEYYKSYPFRLRTMPKMK